MFCKNCGSFVSDDNAKFCPFCGKKMEVESVTTPTLTGNSALRMAGDLGGSTPKRAPSVTQSQPTEPQRDSDFRAPASFGVVKSDVTESPYDTVKIRGDSDIGDSADSGQSDSEKDGLMQKAKRKAANICANINVPKSPKEKKRIVVGAALAVLLIIAVCFAIGQLGSPATRIASAVQKTLDAGSFTVDLTYIWESDEKSNMTADVVFDSKKKELALYGHGQGRDSAIAIYDGYYVESYSGGNWVDDVQDELDVLFNIYREATAKSLSAEDFLYELDGYFADWVYSLDMDKLDECVEAYVKKLNSVKWLKENAGYQTEYDGLVKIYRFSPDCYQFLSESLATFEDAFFNKEAYRELSESLRYERADLRSLKFDISVSIKFGRIVGFEFRFYESDETEILKASIYDIGKTEPDMDRLEDLVYTARKYSSYYN